MMTWDTAGPTRIMTTENNENECTNTSYAHNNYSVIHFFLCFGGVHFIAIVPILLVSGRHLHWLFDHHYQPFGP